MASKPKPSLARKMFTEQPAMRTAFSDGDMFKKLRQRLKKIELDGEELFITEGDTLLDEDQLRVYAAQRELQVRILEGVRSARDAGLATARLTVGISLDDQSRGLLGMVQGDGKLVRWPPGQILTYCVLKKSFPKEAQYKIVKQNMLKATEAWEGTCGVKFEHKESLDESDQMRPKGVVFPVRFIDANGQFIAAAFFPNDPKSRWRVVIDPSYFSDNLSFDRVGVLRHELGHTLGFRHEHIRSGAPMACPDEDPAGIFDLTQYDPKSVMHYFCGDLGSRELAISELDRVGAQKLYGPPLSSFSFVEA